MSHQDEMLYDLYEIASPGMLRNPHWRHYNQGLGPMSVSEISRSVHIFPNTVFNVRLYERTRKECDHE